MSRPEENAPANIFYNASESEKYHNNSRIQAVQREMTLRALELLDLRRPSLILDVGCGSGLSGDCMSEDHHTWIGMDVSADMLQVARAHESAGDLMLADMGDGIPFRAGTFDAAVSISAIQWLCNADCSTAEPRQRLLQFFQTLYSALQRGGKFIAQFYPLGQKQTDMIRFAANKAGFGGGLVVDAPNSKNAKYYLCLTAGPTSLNLQGMYIESIQAAEAKKAIIKGSKQWIRQKKESMRKQGKVVKNDSKFSGRKRKPKF